MDRVIHFLDRIALGSTVVMLAVVVLSVAGRLLFDLTGGGVNLIIPGAEEIARYALLLLVFTALPRAAVSGLISVDILTGLLPDGLRSLLERAWDLLLAVFAAIVGWLFVEQALVMFERGDTTQDLRVPLYLVYGAVALCSFCLMLTGLWLAGRRFRRPGPGES